MRHRPRSYTLRLVDINIPTDLQKQSRLKTEIPWCPSHTFCTDLRRDGSTVAICSCPFVKEIKTKKGHPSSALSGRLGSPCRRMKNPYCVLTTIETMAKIAGIPIIIVWRNIKYILPVTDKNLHP